jgi:CRP-like cAMP-binding protein
MPEPRGDRRPAENRLLASLPGGDYDRLRPLLKPVHLAAKDVVVEANTPISHVYFPVAAVLSMVLVMEDGQAVEVATTGNEGMSGLPIYLGADRSPARVFCQVPGAAMRMEAGAFREEVGRGGPLNDLIRRFSQAVLNQISQTSACNRLHSIEQRLCRWLLMTRDRVGSDHFPLTQEFLAIMLGVKRPSVTVVASAFQKAGVIRYVRGKVEILDGERLESSACECYRVVKEEFTRLLG